MEKDIEWFLVPNTEGKYEITKSGLVRKTGNKILCNLCLNKGYEIVSIKYKGEYRSISVHQLMAITFLGHAPDERRSLCVNHINEIKSDNRLENLEVVTQIVNVRHSAHKKNKLSARYYLGYNAKIKHFNPYIQIGEKFIRFGVFYSANEAREVVRQYYINNNLNYENYERCFKNEGKRKETIRLYNSRKNRANVDNCQQLS